MERVRRPELRGVPEPGGEKVLAWQGAGAWPVCGPRGRVWDRVRPDGGPWEATADLNDAGGAVASGPPNDTVHVETLVNG